MTPKDRRRRRSRRSGMASSSVLAVAVAVVVVVVVLASGCSGGSGVAEPSRQGTAQGTAPAEAEPEREPDASPASSASSTPSTTSTAVPTPLPKPWFAPYVDVTLPPLHRFGDPAENVAADVVLGFVVAHPGAPCTPSWGGHATLDDAAVTFDVDARIAELRSHGGDVMVSFGGQANRELALDCTDAGRLVAAYRSVIERYGVTVVDLDVEGQALFDRAANQRRAAAMKTLQDEARSAGGDLAVWLTVPVLPAGMSPEAIAWIDDVLAAGVDLAGVNVMTMNFGPKRPAGHDMVAASEEAAKSTHRQLDDAYRRAGTPLPSEQIWAKVGLTPMIGQNDLAEDRLGLVDAPRFAALIEQYGMGRLSMWSLNRDRPCGSGVDLAVANDRCSGEPQEKLAFSRTFDVFEGRPAG